MKPKNLIFTCSAVQSVALLFMAGGCNKESDDITDGDGNVYTTITIGSQVWLKENLKTTTYNDGNAISVTSDSWNELLTPAYSGLEI